MQIRLLTLRVMIVPKCETNIGWLLLQLSVELSVKADRQMDGWNILYLLFFLALRASSIHVCLSNLSVHPIAYLSGVIDSITHAKLNCYSKHKTMQGQWKQFRRTSLISNIWNAVALEISSVRLTPNSPNYSSESHSAAVISGMRNQKFFTRLKATKQL